MNKIIIYILILSTTICGFAQMASAAGEDYDKFLDSVEKRVFHFFLDTTNPETGLTLNTTENCSPATNAASGFMLSALPIGVERGWISRDKAYAMALKTLKLYDTMESNHGFTYHYFNVQNCGRMWKSEVSCIDTALFLAGAITAGEYFEGTEVSRIADELYKKTEWDWFLNGDYALQMSWKPETGFSGRIDSFSEGILCYILAMGSPTHPISNVCWDSFLRPVSRYNGYRMIYVADGSLFQYLFPLAWLDLRDKHDKYADYWQNAVKAVKANKKYCLDNGDSFQTYREGFWGLSASLSPDGYRNFGAKPGMNRHNGTVAPYAVAGAIPLVPSFSITDYKNMFDRVPTAIGRYGLTDAFNIDRKWACDYYISIDEGLAILMIENYRTGLIWKYFMRNIHVKKGLEAAGFVWGRQEEVSETACRTGNPDDKLTVQRLTQEIKIDGDLSDWEKSGMQKIILTGKDNKNNEMTQGHIKDDSDLSGYFYLGHDNDNLYMGCHVKDNEIICNETGTNIYKDDCVEMFFDVNKDGFYFDKNKYDYQLGIAPTGPANKPQIWAWGYVQKNPANIEYAARIVPDGYIVEARIPFSEINGFGPKQNRNIRFSLSIHDRDKDKKQKKLTWSIDSSSQPGKIFFGTLELAG